MSKRAEELVDKADAIFSDGKARPRARVMELIDAELRKERERAARRADLCYRVLPDDTIETWENNLSRLRAAILSDEED